MNHNPSHFKPGNQIAKKLHTLELKQEAYRQYCDHIASGRPKRAWTFDHPTITLTWETMEKYIRNDESVFDPQKKKEAEAKSLKKWFDLLSDIAFGINRKGNVAALQIILRNVHKWDRIDGPKDDEYSNASLMASENVLHQLRCMQEEHKKSEEIKEIDIQCEPIL